MCQRSEILWSLEKTSLLSSCFFAAPLLESFLTVGHGLF